MPALLRDRTYLPPGPCRTVRPRPLRSIGMHRTVRCGACSGESQAGRPTVSGVRRYISFFRAFFPWYTILLQFVNSLVGVAFIAWFVLPGVARRHLSHNRHSCCNAVMQQAATVAQRTACVGVTVLIASVRGLVGQSMTIQSLTLTTASSMRGLIPSETLTTRVCVHRSYRRDSGGRLAHALCCLFVCVSCMLHVACCMSHRSYRRDDGGRLAHECTATEGVHQRHNGSSVPPTMCRADLSGCAASRPRFPLRSPLGPLVKCTRRGSINRPEHVMYRRAPPRIP